MASLAPASCRPWAMDQAMLRLLARPKTTATRPSRLKDIDPPLKKGKDISGREAVPTGGKKQPGPAALLGACSGLRPAGLFVLLEISNPARGREFRTKFTGKPPECGMGYSGIGAGRAFISSANRTSFRSSVNSGAV